VNGKKIILAKPQNFINLSGEVVKRIMAFYKTGTEDLLVIHDDLAITCGKYKLATNSTSAGHNGVQNIIDELGTKKFTRLRIGIKNERGSGIATPIKINDFVLGKLEQAELEKITLLKKDILKEIEALSLA
jgi:PTH1 family peptidyl-tRNA hydrolase